MAERVLNSMQEIEDFVRGCTFYGTGGGGTPESGLAALKSEFEKGTKIYWMDYSDVPDDALVITTYLMGSIAPVTDEMRKEMNAYGLTESLFDEKDRMIEAVKELQEFLGQEIYGIVPIELGAANSSAPIAVANALGMPAVDGDYAGRAIPEMIQTTPRINKKSLVPIASVDEFGNTAVIKAVANDQLAERIGKLLSTAAYGLVGNAGILMTGKEMKEIVIPGTLTECIEAGRLIREFRTSLDPVEELKQALDCYIIGRGKITNKESYTDKGYYFGTFTFEGLDQYAGNEYKVWFQNENHIAWKNGKPVTMSPDIITMIDNKTGEPTTNAQLQVGDEMAIIGIKGRKEFDNEVGIDILGPKHFGFDIEYKKIDQLVKK